MLLFSTASPSGSVNSVSYSSQPLPWRPPGLIQQTPASAFQRAKRLNVQYQTSGKCP
ncbi:hypothetical protein PG5_48310 [Pseudomonas sp. G5(2012)]|nr:hypothetical protein PG5_48310 [Pseudomonas sp. G5(2012)]